jgi:hypothetical protein
MYEEERGEGDGSRVVVEEELEGSLDEMEVDLEKGTAETEGDDDCEEESEVVGEDEPVIRKGKEKVADAENGKGVGTREAAEDCEDAEFVEVPRK